MPSPYQNRMSGVDSLRTSSTSLGKLARSSDDYTTRRAALTRPPTGSPEIKVSPVTIGYTEKVLESPADAHAINAAFLRDMLNSGKLSDEAVRARAIRTIRHLKALDEARQI